MKRFAFKPICWGNGVFFIIVICLFIVSVLSACGTKSDLQLPDKPIKIRHEK